MPASAHEETRAQGIVASAVAAAGLEARLAVCERVREDWTDAGLRPEEAALVAGAQADVRAAFGAGRACAHAALAELGGTPDAPLLRLGGDGPWARAPAWPEGVLGSISHSASHCAAIAASSKDVTALGLDVESPSRVTPKLLDRVCTPRERARFESADASWPGALHFSAKEAFYKVWSPLTRRVIGFRDVEVEGLGEGRLEVRIVGDVDHGGLGCGPFEGGWAVRGDLIAAVVWVSRG